MAKGKKQPTADQEKERLRQRFHAVTAPLKPTTDRQPAKPQSSDDKLADTLATYLADDRAKNVLTWLDQEAANANQRAHIAAVNGKDQRYWLGQESGFRLMARKIREIRGESTPLN